MQGEFSRAHACPESPRGDNLSFRLDTDLLDGFAVAVPEPRTLMLLVVGAVAIARRRRALR